MTNKVKSFGKKVKESFVVEVGVGVGPGIYLDSKFGEAGLGVMKTTNYGYSNGKVYTYTSSKNGFKAELKIDPLVDVEIGVGSEVTHYDHENQPASHGNPILFESNVRGCPYATVENYSSFAVNSALYEARNNDSFKGLHFGFGVGLEFEIKIGFNN